MKIIVKSAGPLDATSFYRCWGITKNIEDQSNIRFTPYEKTLLTVTNSQLNIQNQPIFSWASARQYDAIYCQRLYTETDFKLMEYCKVNGLKVIYELDDNLWEIPSSYRIKENFTPKILNAITDMVKISDLVIVSTQSIADYILTNFGVKCEVVNNGIDLKKFPINDYNENGPVIWRGSSTHVEDLRKYREVIEEIGKHNEIEFWGYDPVKERPLLNIPNRVYVSPLDPMHYFEELKLRKPKFFLVPLAENIFNAGKSNIAWLEVTISGGICVSNQWGEFEGKGIKFADIESSHRGIWEDSVAQIRENYDLTKLNKKRIELFNSL